MFIDTLQSISYYVAILVVHTEPRLILQHSGHYKRNMIISVETRPSSMFLLLSSEWNVSHAFIETRFDGYVVTSDVSPCILNDTF